MGLGPTCLRCLKLRLPSLALMCRRLATQYDIVVTT